jgi:hypothetical protein
MTAYRRGFAKNRVPRASAVRITNTITGEVTEQAAMNPAEAGAIIRGRRATHRSYCQGCNTSIEIGEHIMRKAGRFIHARCVKSSSTTT